MSDKLFIAALCWGVGLSFIGIGPVRCIEVKFARAGALVAFLVATGAYMWDVLP